MTRFTTILTVAALTIVVVACSTGASLPSASSSPSSSPRPSLSAVPLITAEEAAARVVHVAPQFAGIGPKDPNLIGGCCFWEATQTAAGFTIVFEIGSGDCQSGCIDRHRWTYSVPSSGPVSLLSESGPPVPSGGATSGIIPNGSGIQGRALAGPTCPVVTVNDPSCDDRPIPGATVLVLDTNGAEVARLTTDGAGHYLVTLPSGSYSIEPQPVEGIMQAAPAVAVTVGDRYETVDLAYDTGIR